MAFPQNYVFALSDAQIKFLFPNSQKDQNFVYTSFKTAEYNCIAWSIEIIDDFIQLKDSFGMITADAAIYIDFFQQKGFVETVNRDVEDSKIKIAVYIDTSIGEFKHVARLLSNGKWTSKLGRAEDIEHDTPEVLIGQFYGNTVIIMEKIAA